MRKIVFAVSFGLVLLAGLGYGGWRLYKRHLSSDLKRTLAAAADETATEADIHVYIRDARVQVRTARDREVLSELERAIGLLQEADDISQKHYKATMERISSMSSDPCLQGYSGLKTIDDLNKRECDEAIKRRKLDDDLSDREDETRKTDMETGKKLYQQFRSDIGLPPLKVQ